MKLYWYAGCSTCKKARKHLGGRDVTVVELKTDPPTAAELADLHGRSGLPLKKFFNVAGQSYRGGGFKDRIGSMTDQDKYEALVADSMLSKRPILDLGDRVLVGFKEADWP